MICTRCGVDKFKKDFGTDNKSASGRFPWCKFCKKQHQKEYVKALRATLETPTKASSRRTRCEAYGIAEEDYSAILVLQGAVCAGCRKPPKDGKNLAIDHTHQSGERRRLGYEKGETVRGLLCNVCNRLLGRARDNANVLRNLAIYLENPPAKHVVRARLDKVFVLMETYEAKKTG